MMAKAGVSQAQIKRAVSVLSSMGHAVGGLRLHPDGTVDVLIGPMSVDQGAALEAELDAELAEWDRMEGARKMRAAHERGRQMALKVQRQRLARGK